MTRKCYRSAYAKFRCGVAPIKIESCRYCLNRVPVEQRLCDECNLIEDEFYVLMVCTVSDIDYQFSTYKHQQSGHFQIKIYFPTLPNPGYAPRRCAPMVSALPN